MFTNRFFSSTQWAAAHLMRGQRLSYRNLRYMSTVEQRSAAAQSEISLHKDILNAYTHNPIEGYIRNSPFENVVPPNVTIDEYVWQNVSKWPNHIATVCGITGRSYTFSRLRDHCAALAVRLQNQFKLRPGNVIAVCLPNIPEYPLAVFGSIEAGLVVTTINPIYTADEIARQLIASDAQVVFATPEIYTTVQQAVVNAKRDIKIVCIKTSNDEVIPTGSIDFAELIDTKNVDYSSLQLHKRHPDDLAFLPFSSGTTGLPKGVMLSHNNIGVNCEQLSVKLGEAPLMLPTTNDHQESVPSVLPFFHIYGLTCLMISKLSLGAKNVTLPSFTPQTFMKAVRDHQATLLHLVPPIILFLAGHDAVNPKDLETVRMVMSGAAPLGAMDVERLYKKAPQLSLIQGYGLTETSPVCLMNIPGSKRVASVGVPSAVTQAKIVALDDKTAKGLPAEETGELWIRGPQNMLGYLNNQKATDEMLVDGWIRTGDIAYYDKDGFFYITDRLKELIKVKGFQVPPAELEEVLRSHPDVADAAVVGVPHDRNGEAPRAFVVLHKDSKVTDKEIFDFVTSKVVEYKQLTGGVQFIDAIPKNSTGKIMRREIKQKYC